MKPIVDRDNGVRTGAKLPEWSKKPPGALTEYRDCVAKIHLLETLSHRTKKQQQDLDRLRHRWTLLIDKVSHFEKRKGTCCICGRTFSYEVQIRPDREISMNNNRGACDRPRCILLRMRECM